MKCALSLFFAAAASVSAQESFTYETPACLFSNLDANGDGRRDVAIADRSAGTLTIGFQDAGGGFVWSSPEPTGIANASGLAAGNMINAASDAVALTARNSNHIALITVSGSAAPPVVRHVFPASRTAKWLAAVNVDADSLAELIVSAENGAQFQVEGVDALDATPVSLWTQNYSGDTRRINPLRPRTGTAVRLADLFGNTFYMDEVLPTGMGASNGLAGSAVTVDSLYAVGNFGGSAFATAIVYEPGATTARAATLSLPGASYTWSAISTLTFPSAIQLIVTVPGTGGTRLAVLFTDGTARTYDYSGTGNVSLRATLPGTHELLVPAGNDTLLTMRASAWHKFNTTGTGTLTASGTGAFPRPSASSLYSNVIYLNGEPFANAAASPTATQRTFDWTTSASGGPLNWSIASLTQSAGGLSITGNNASLTAPVSSSHSLVNQYRPNISVRALEGAVGAATGDVDIQPPAGVYAPLASGDKFVIRFVPSISGDSVFYRLNGSGAWTLYNFNSPPSITAAGSVEAYAHRIDRRSPVRSASYSFSAAPALTTGGLTDSDGDGMSDQWEKTFGITDPAGDADGDGLSNLAEFQNGTDPSISNGGAPLVLNSSRISNGSILRLEWSASNASVILQESTNLSAWSTVTTGIVVSGGLKRYDVPLTPLPAVDRFYRLKQP